MHVYTHTHTHNRRRSCQFRCHITQTSIIITRHLTLDVTVEAWMDITEHKARGPLCTYLSVCVCFAEGVFVVVIE